MIKKMNKYLVILLSLLFPCVLLAQNRGIRAVDNKGTIIYVDPSKWFQVGSNLFNKNTNGNVAIGVIDTSSFKPVDYSRLYISNGGITTLPVLKLDTPFDGELTDDVLTWDPSDFSVKKIAISTLSPNDWHILGNAGTDPATNFLGTTDNQDLSFRTYNTERMRIASSGNIGIGTVAPASTLEINSTAANTSGLRLTNLTSASPASTGATIGVNAAGDVVVVNSSVTATTVSNTSTGNTLTTTVNDVTGTAVNIINSNTLTATDGKLVSTVNGVETTPEVPILISANNGLTATNGNVQLDGALIKPTTITTDAANTLAVAGLQSASPTGTDNIVVVNSSGVLSTLDRSILNNGWLLKGNAGTNPANNFLGTTDDQPLFFRINDNYAGHIAQNNTSLGNSSLNPSATGQFNTAMGSNSLSALSDGTYNTATGFQNFQGLTSGSYNVAMGVENIGALTSGWNNIAIGAGNLSIETGNQNIAIGAGVGQGLLNGSSNILIGGSTSYRIDASGPNKSNEMNIGNALFGKAINSAIGTASIGINTNNPGNTFEVKSAAANTSGLRLSNLTSTSPATATSVATLGINATGDVVVVNSAPATTTNTLTATNGSLISTVNGVATTPAVPVLTSANNGLTATNGNVQLGGTLIQPTTINTNSNNFAITNLPAGAPSDRLVAIDPSSGILKTVTQAMWSTIGNAGTNPANNFLGTTDDQPLNFKINNEKAGRIVKGVAANGSNSVTALGYQALNNFDGYDNTAIGYQALTALNNTGAGDNVAVGYKSLVASTNGLANTAIGSQSLARNTSGQWNSALGYLSLVGITTGNNNSGIGVQALYSVNSGTYNVGVGVNSLVHFTTGSYNIGIGTSTGTAIGSNWYTGSSNILIGMSSANNVSPSSYTASNELNIGNTLYGKNVNGAVNGTTGAIGINTNAPATTLDVNGQVTVRNLPAGTAADNIVVADTTTGLLKTVVSNATFWKTTGNGGTNPANNFIGTTDNNNLMFKVDNTKAGVISTGGGTGFGRQSLLNGLGTTNTAFGGNTLMNVTGTSNVAVGYRALEANTVGNYNTAMGVGALLGNTSGSQNIAIGNDALGSLAGGTATANIALGYQAGKNLTSGNNNIAIGSSVSLPSSSGNYQLNIGNAIYGIGVNNPVPNTAQIGINTNAPNATLDVQGSQVVKVAIATGSYAVKTNDYMLVVPSGSSPANTITLPSAAANIGRVLMIKTSIINTSSVTVKTSSASEKFDGSWPASAISGGPIAGSTSILLDSTGINDHITVISDGTSWYVSN